MAKPTGDPFHDMATMVGMMTIQWAWAENALALSIGIIDENVAELRGHPELPLSLKRRLSYLRTALRDVALLKPLQQDGLALVKSFVEFKERRHNLVHGSAWLMPHGGFELQRFAIKGRQHTAEQKPIEIGDVVLFNKELDGLCHAAMAFLLRVEGIFSAYRPVAS